MSHYIGVDVGTGSARACVIDESGDIVGLASENIALWHPKQDYYEQSTDDIWSKIKTAVKRALAERNVSPQSVRGIGFDATCSLAVFDAETDKPVSVSGPDYASERNVILWLDHRPLEETDKINSTKHNLLRYVGGTMSPEMEVPKILWLKNNMPAELFRRCKFFDLADALTHIATGNEKRSFCSVVCKQGYVPVGVDGSVKGWQADFLQQIGLGELVENDFKRMGGVDGVNGQYLSAGEFVGSLCAQAAEDLGLPAGIAVGSGVIDAYAGWIGTVGAKLSIRGQEHIPESVKRDQSQALTRLAVVAGTSTCHLAMTPEPVFVQGIWGPYRDTIFPDRWMAEGGQSATGELLNFITETHPAHAEAVRSAERQGLSIYSYLNEHLREMAARDGAPSVSHLCRHMFFYGDLFGNRSPLADPHMAGSLIGMSSDKSVDSLARLYYVTLEFIALQTKQIVEAMNNAGHKISTIFMSGSQCQNPVLMDLIATACDMPVVIPQYVSAAVCHGAAMLGAKAASSDESGRTEDLWKIMDRMSKPGRAVYPLENQMERALLRVKYDVFLEQLAKQREYRDRVDAATSGWVG
ncbi:hypothetical protein KEM52_002297 [Ascosphaera acerosa]|nr:hypothetical protein KEM52_002297 [Ascosphaera acerosa]